jgi:predicted RecB family endonuclease
LENGGAFIIIGKLDLGDASITTRKLDIGGTSSLGKKLGTVFDVEWHHLLPQVFLLPAIDALISAVKGSMKQRLTDFSNVRWV